MPLQRSFVNMADTAPRVSEVTKTHSALGQVLASMPDRGREMAYKLGASNYTIYCQTLTDIDKEIKKRVSEVSADSSEAKKREQAKVAFVGYQAVSPHRFAEDGLLSRVAAA